LTSQVAKDVEKAKILLLITDPDLNIVSLSACFDGRDAYLNVNVYLGIVHMVRIKEQLPSNKMDIHLIRQSEYVKK